MKSNIRTRLNKARDKQIFTQAQPFLDLVSAQPDLYLQPLKTRTNKSFQKQPIEIFELSDIGSSSPPHIPLAANTNTVSTTANPPISLPEQDLLVGDDLESINLTKSHATSDSDDDFFSQIEEKEAQRISSNKPTQSPFISQTQPHHLNNDAKNEPEFGNEMLAPESPSICVFSSDPIIQPLDDIPPPKPTNNNNNLFLNKRDVQITPSGKRDRAYRLTQVDSPTRSKAPEKPEIGSILSEKIALLEQKISFLDSVLQKHGIDADSAIVDSKLKEVERRILSFDEPEIEDFIGSSSPVITGINSFAHSAFDDSDLGFEVSEVTQSKSGEPTNPNSSILSFDPIPETLDEDSGVKSQISHKNWYRELMHILHTKFGLQGFRSNQIEAINETLQGQDVVVLMPTGGGKSLCYQLPALVEGGATKGTSVVISPLISLMQDQVYHLKNRNIEAEMLNSRLSAQERSEVMAKLSSGQLKLLYISPEMLSASAFMKNTLQDLFSQNKLARIVIDEAHCVSAWGHDFRPDYMELTKIKDQFKGLPIMALTATANDRVLLDIVGCLRANPLVLKQSFNRQNLIYEVKKKSNTMMTEIIAICKSYYRKTGIVYCLSKKQCETTAAQLKQAGVNAQFYHAGMDVEDRARVQSDWQEGSCSVVCATIAFGMGIDKPDVRFVIHSSLPRNIEGYYQETGRAGRDGKLSKCILFYNFRDFANLKKMIMDDKDLKLSDREHHASLLDKVMQFCENDTDCRRKQVLQYFNESFDARLCNKRCDNCLNMRGQTTVVKDFSLEGKKVVQVISEIENSKVTTQQLTDIVNGRNTSKIRTCKYDKLGGYGCLKSVPVGDVERIIHSMLSENILEEYSVFNKSRYPQTYVKRGRNSGVLVSGRLPLKLKIIDVERKRPQINYPVPKRIKS